MAERSRAPPLPPQQQTMQQLQQQQPQSPQPPSPFQVYPPGYAPPQSLFARGPAELPLSLASLMLLLRDAEYLTARYGSTAAACARLEELEHAHAESQAQLAALQQKLGHLAMLQSSSSGIGLDMDALLGFLQRHVACRGSLALLQPVLLDFQRSLVLPPDARFPTRDVLLSVQEIAGSGAGTARQLQQTQRQPLDTQHSGAHANDTPSPMPLDGARKKRHPDLTRLTPKDKASTASPVRANGSATGGTTAPRLIAPAGGGSGRASSASKSGSSADQRQEETTQAVNAAAMLSALSRPNGSSVGSSNSHRSATATVTTTAPTKAAERAKATTTRRGQSQSAVAPAPPGALTTATSTARTAVAAAAASQQKKRATLRAQDEEREDGISAGAPETTQDKSVGSGEPTDGAVGTRKRSTASLAAAAASHEVVVKQNLSLPHDKRNIVELKQSSQHLTLENLDALNRRAPWDEVYKLRTTFSHVLDYASLDERARKWFLGALRVQFVWRREFWERLHWLPMSETVCCGAGWERYRQTRKRRANKAIAAWRKVYSDSLELMRQRLLPEDMWCDVALWYMPSTPLYWLPNSPDLVAELALVDAKHPVRCYFVQDFRKHPFYNDDDIQRKYPRKYELPTPQMLALQNEDKESRVNMTPE